MIAGAELRPISEHVETTQALRSVAEELRESLGSAMDGVFSPFWNAKWFPLLAMTGGEVVADLTRPSDRATPVRVRWTHDWDSEDYPSWPSISAFVDWIIARFEDGTYGFDDQGFVTGPWLEKAD